MPTKSTQKVDANTLEAKDRDELRDAKRLMKDIRVYIGYTEFEQRRLTDEHRQLLLETKIRIAATDNPRVWLNAASELMKGRWSPIAPPFDFITSSKPEETGGRLAQR